MPRRLIFSTNFFFVDGLHRDGRKRNKPFRLKVHGGRLELDRIDSASERGRRVPLVRQLNVYLQLHVRATRETHVRLSLCPLEGRSDDRVVLLVLVDQVLELLNVRPSP